MLKSAPPPEKMDHNSQMVKASIIKLSDILHLTILLHLSLFGAKLNAKISHRRLWEIGAFSQKFRGPPKKSKFQLHPREKFI